MFCHAKLDAAYIHTCLLFGMCHWMQIFQRQSNVVCFDLHKQGYDVINYVDDFVGFRMPSIAKASFDVLLELFHSLSLDISPKMHPNTKALCLVVKIDTI